MDKIIDINCLENLKKDSNQKIALCHGCFDLFHIGHLRHLQAAKDGMDILVVSITTDKFIDKGPGRPAFNEKFRSEMLSNIEIVDYVVVNDNPTAIEVIERLLPDRYAKGDEYLYKNGSFNKNIYEEELICKSKNIEIFYTSEYTDSSTRILNSYFKI